MSSLRVVIADDEPLARQRLKRLLSEAGCEVMAEFPNGVALLEWFQAPRQVDALFLDIEMPRVSGLEALADLEHPPLAVFVTAHGEHALQAFALEAVDYLLKPVFPDRLAQCLERLRRRLQSTALPAKGDSVQPLNRVPVKAGDGRLLLDPRKISHFEVESSAAWAWMGGQRYKTPWRTLLEVEEALPNLGLFRISRSIMVQLQAVIGIRTLKGNRSSLRMLGGLELEVSRSISPKLKALVGMERERAR